MFAVRRQSVSALFALGIFGIAGAAMHHAASQGKAAGLSPASHLTSKGHLARGTIASSLTYALSFTLRLEGEEGKAPLLASQGSGRLIITQTAGEGGKIWRGEIQAEAGVGDHTFHFRRSAPGRVLELLPRAELDVQSKALVRSALSALQIVRPVGASRDLPSWSIRESDAMGWYTARYTKTGPGAYTKEKGIYDGAPKHRSVIFDAKIEVDDVGNVVSSSLHEQVATKLTSSDMRSEVHLTLSLVGLGQARAPAPGAEYLAERPAPRRTHLVHHTPSVTARSFEQLVARLLEQKSDSARWDAQRDLVAHLRDHPDAAPGALALLRSKEGDPRDMLLGALAESDTRQAQEALISLAGDRSAPMDFKVSALGHLSMSSEPSEEAFDGLATLARTGDEILAPMATRVLGSLSRQGAEGDDGTRDRAEAFVDDMLSQLDTNRDPDARLTALDALGNSGSPRGFASLRQRVGDADPHVRRAAVEALRLIVHPEVDPLLATVLRSDPEAAVRGAALFAAQFRPLFAPFVMAVAEAAQKDEASAVRLAIAGYASERAMRSQQLLEVLEYLAEKDPDEDVRKAAALGLAGGRSHLETL